MKSGDVCKKNQSVGTKDKSGKIGAIPKVYVFCQKEKIHSFARFCQAFTGLAEKIDTKQTESASVDSEFSVSLRRFGHCVVSTNHVQ